MVPNQPVKGPFGPLLRPGQIRSSRMANVFNMVLFYHKQNYWANLKIKILLKRIFLAEASINFNSLTFFYWKAIFE
jgi:hypothetical protein